MGWRDLWRRERGTVEHPVALSDDPVHQAPAPVAELTVTADAFELWSSPRFPNVDLVGEHFQRHVFAEICPRHGMESGGEVLLDAILVPHRANPYDPHAVSVHVEGLQVGFLDHDDAELYHPVLLRLLDNGRVGVTRARIEATHDGGIWSAHVTVALGEPDTVAPANVEPAHGVILPEGRTVRVAGVHRHLDILETFLAEELPGPVFLTLVPGRIGVPGHEPPVQVHLDGHQIGHLTAETRREYGALLDRVGAAGADVVVHGRIGPHLAQPEVSIHVARSTAIPVRWLDEEIAAHAGGPGSDVALGAG